MRFLLFGVPIAIIVIISKRKPKQDIELNETNDSEDLSPNSEQVLSQLVKALKNNQAKHSYQLFIQWMKLDIVVDTSASQFANTIEYKPLRTSFLSLEDYLFSETGNSNSQVFKIATVSEFVGEGNFGIKILFPVSIK